MPENSYPFPTYSGLLQPVHYKQIGSAIWLFLWCISSTTTEKEKDGIVWGIVLGNKPMKLSELAEIFDVNEKTVSRWLESLERHDYIRITRAPYGLILSVKRSKKWASGRTDIFVRSLETDQTKMSVLSGRDQTDMSDLPDKNVRSNKDIIKILIDRWIKDLSETDSEFLKSKTEVLRNAINTFPTDFNPEESEDRFSEIEGYYLQQTRRTFSNSTDWNHVEEVAKEPMPLEFIYFGIDLAVARKKKTRKRESDTIRTFSYCKAVIFGCWDDFKAAVEAANKPAVPRQRKSNNRQLSKNEKAIQEIREAEERERSRNP